MVAILSTINNLKTHFQCEVTQIIDYITSMENNIDQFCYMFRELEESEITIQNLLKEEDRQKKILSIKTLLKSKLDEKTSSLKDLNLIDTQDAEKAIEAFNRKFNCVDYFDISTYWDDWAEWADWDSDNGHHIKLTPQNFYNCLVKKNRFEGLTREEVDTIFPHLEAIENNDCIKSLERKIDELKKFITLYSMFESTSNINIYRQSFILMVTVFEAVFIDILKEVYTSDFTGFVECVKPVSKISYSDITNLDDLTNLNRILVESKLESTQISAILNEFKKYKTSCFLIHENNEFKKILEIIKRRNIHIHNKGMVDYKYLDKDKEGKIKFNPYQLVENSYAEIDSQYFRNSCTLLKEFIDNIN